MENKDALAADTIVQHLHYGKGKIVCQYEDASIGGMVEVHWLDRNEVLDHCEKNLRYGLTTIAPPATSKVSPWLLPLDKG